MEFRIFEWLVSKSELFLSVVWKVVAVLEAAHLTEWISENPKKSGIIGVAALVAVSKAVIEINKRGPKAQQLLVTDPMPPPEHPPVSLVLKIGSGAHSIKDGLLIMPPMLGAPGAGRGKGPIAKVNAQSNGLFELVNLASLSWQVMQGGNQTDIATGQAVRLVPGAVIDFRGVKGVVQPG